MGKKPRLSRDMSEEHFDNGYWYADELKSFARDSGIKRASAMRKDQLENAIRTWLRSGVIPTQPDTPKRVGARDFELGLRLDLAITHYTSNKTTKDFILDEARKIEPGFTRKPGTRYLLNRWREEQMAAGRKLTYGDLVQQALTLNQTKSGPLRLEHGRYINFISDFMAANPGARHADAVRAWAEVKRIYGRKTYEAWKNSEFGSRK
jgi:SAP domain-containing new25